MVAAWFPATSAGAAPPERDPISICHATGSATDPFVLVTFKKGVVPPGHQSHADDIIPAPPGGCPGVEPEPEPTPVSICHATGSEKDPFVVLTFENGVVPSGHQGHADDIIPAPEGGFPAGEVSTEPVPNPPVTPTDSDPTPFVKQVTATPPAQPAPVFVPTPVEDAKPVVASVGNQGELPRTGTATSALVGLALSLLGVGTVLVALGRRKGPAPGRRVLVTG